MTTSKEIKIKTKNFNINRTANGCIKNHEGKKLCQKPWEKLLCVWPISPNLIPEVEGFAIFEINSGKPFVMVRRVSDPTDKKLPASATPA